MNKLTYFGPFLLLFALCGCVSKAPIPDLTPPELIQQAQAASDKNKYTQALRYYEAILERYPSYIDEICAAEYEIAFIHYKQKKYDQASAEFAALLTRYDTPDAELLPPQFKRLAELGLQKIAEKQRKKR
ncbi:MAG: hypothetical protein LBG73_05850 [Spirochaetaceae bacterium]|jgi:outer membrane protein assembly factor BamD (BamD/ComL family)|nr:hypothetical protein [Spirochaetaceae bacterium]